MSPCVEKFVVSLPLKGIHKCSAHGQTLWKHCLKKLWAWSWKSSLTPCCKYLRLRLLVSAMLISRTCSVDLQQRLLLAADNISKWLAWLRSTVCSSHLYRKNTIVGMSVSQCFQDAKICSSIQKVWCNCTTGIKSRMNYIWAKLGSLIKIVSTLN